jgi:hypothetical protein
MSEDGDSEGEPEPLRQAVVAPEPEAGAARRDMLPAPRPPYAAHNPMAQARPAKPNRR